MKIASFLLFLFASLSVFAQLPPEVPLYPEGIPNNPVSYPSGEMVADSAINPLSLSSLNRVYSNVSEPTYMLFRATEENNREIGLVIFPGGGLKNVWLDKEGTDIGMWLAHQGISCMVVKYRTNYKDDKGDWGIDFDDYKGAVYQDARTAMLRMKELAPSLHFDPNTLGMMGFSAGGWLAERMVYKYYESDNEWNPAFVALIYHGNNVKQIKKAEDKEKLPPFFMAIAEDDHKLPFKDVYPYLKMVSETVPNSELHVYPSGGHGLGLAYDENAEVSTWKTAFVAWLEKLYDK